MEEKTIKRTETGFAYSCLDMVHEKDIYPPLLDLIKEADGEMLFVEKDDNRFTMKEYVMRKLAEHF